MIGTDLSAIQASRGLSNCQFVQEDTEDEWTIGENFDYIHLRMMVSCYADPRGVIQKLFTKVKPGGWVEYQDISFNVDDVDSSLQTKGASIRRWAHLCIAGAAVMGKSASGLLKRMSGCSDSEQGGIGNLQRSTKNG